MELDVNIAAHDLLWRRKSLTTKKAYVESYGAGRAELVEKEVQRLVAPVTPSAAAPISI